MSRFPVRLALLFTCVAAFAAAAFLIFTSEQRTRASESAMRTFDEGARRTMAIATELRAAQQSYVAVGQGPDFWFARVATLEKEFTTAVAALKQQAIAPDSALALDDAAGVLQDFLEVDKRARDYVKSHQPAQASDLIFADGFELTQKAFTDVARALNAEAVATDAAAAAARRKEALAAAGAAGFGLLVAALLVFTGRTRQTDTDAAAGPLVPLAPLVNDAPMSAETLDDLQEFGLVANPARDTAAEPTLDLEAIASICAELARVMDTKALPDLLARAASVLHAAGIVVWIADPDGRELTPILVQGYPPHIANRLGTLSRDAANLTAAAYRTALLQTVKGDTVSNGAIAAPLVTSGGCAGVLAIEMKDGGEQQHALLAAAGIIASQLSTLVGPPAARRAEAAG